MAFNNEGGRRRAPRRRRKVCVFCGKDNVIDFKDAAKLRRYISERGNPSEKSYRKLCKASESHHGCCEACKTFGNSSVRRRLMK